MVFKALTVFNFNSGFSVKFLMVGGTNSMASYNLMYEGHSIKLEVWGEGAVSLPAGPGQRLGGGLELFEKFFEYTP